MRETMKMTELEEKVKDMRVSTVSSRVIKHLKKLKLNGWNSSKRNMDIMTLTPFTSNRTMQKYKEHDISIYNVILAKVLEAVNENGYEIK